MPINGTSVLFLASTIGISYKYLRCKKYITNYCRNDSTRNLDENVKNRIQENDLIGKNMLHTSESHQILIFSTQ